MTDSSTSQETTNSKLKPGATLHRMSDSSYFANRNSSHQQQQRPHLDIALLLLLAVLISTSPLLLTAANALPVVPLKADCSQPAAKQQLQLRNQQQALSLRQDIVPSPHRPQHAASISSVAIKRRHYHSHCHHDYQHKSSSYTHPDVVETIAGLKKAAKHHTVKQNEPEDGDSRDHSDKGLILKQTKTSTSRRGESHHHQQQQQALEVADKKPLNCLNSNLCTMETIMSLKTTPTIFYVPHQDDDALAMALAIREHIEAGRKVIVHLYSDGINTALRDIIAGTVTPCPLQHPPHHFNVTLQDVVTGRTHEFRQSLRQLGVLDENVFETGWSDIEPIKDYARFKKKLKDLIIGYEKKHPGASHKCISGEYDRDGLGRNPTHRACWDVARELIDEHPTGYPSSNQLWDFRFYRTYTYYRSPEHREAQYIRALPQFLKYKQHALDQYKKWYPSHGELAWGYHSVKALIDASYIDPYVYVDMLDNDPTNPENPSHMLTPNTILVQSPEDKTQLLDRLPPKDMEAIRTQEAHENEEATRILERFERAMHGPEGQGYNPRA